MACDSLSLREHGRAFALFQKLDCDGDGAVARDDLACVLRGCQWTNAEIDAMFAEADADSNGALDFEEFLTWLFCDGVLQEKLSGCVDTFVPEPGLGEGFRWQEPESGGDIQDSGTSVTASGERLLESFFASVFLPPVGVSSWKWRLLGSSNLKHPRSFLEVGIMLEGGDIQSNSISIKLATEGAQVPAASGSVSDGDIEATLDMDGGFFSIMGSPDGPKCHLSCADIEDSVHSGVGKIKGHFWRPFARCSRSKGLQIQLVGLSASGRADGLPLQMAFGASAGNAKAHEWLKRLLPGSGGQPGPGIGDIQCVLPAVDEHSRGGLYISGAFPVTPKNLDMIQVTAVLRLGSRFAPLPEAMLVKMVQINDNLEACIAAHIPECIAFIEENLAGGRSVLVHCGAGMSRSGAVVVAYLMFALGLSFAEALSKARQAREWIRPNNAFCTQLEAYEEELRKAGHYKQ